MSFTIFFRRDHVPAIVAALLLLALPAPAVAQTGSVAVEDGYRSVLINPAGLGVGNGVGVAGELGYSESTWRGEDERVESWAAFFNLENLSYAYRERPVSGEHTLTAAGELAGNLYGGLSYLWAPGNFEEGDLRLGALYRPVRALSTGATLTVDQNQAVGARLGLGVRPLAALGAGASRFTLFGDLPYAEEAWLLPTVGVEARPVDGLELGVSYDAERESLLGSIAFSLSSFRFGNRSTAEGGDGLQGGSFFFHLSPKRFAALAPPGESTFLDYAPGQEVVERRTTPEVWPFTRWDTSVSALTLATEIRRLARDDEVEGILFRKQSFQTSFANIEEIEAALEEFRGAGKRVVYYYENVGNLNYALAAATGDEIYLHPAGSVFLTGRSITRAYSREFLDTVGIEVRAFAGGEYKNLGTVYTDTEMPEEEREALDYLLGGLYDAFTGMIEGGRGERLAAPVDEIIDGGPYLLAEEALEAGLVDRLLYEDEIIDALDALEPRARIRGADDREEIRYPWSDRRRAKVALIYVTGPITTGFGTAGQTAGSDSLAAAIAEARNDESIEAVLLRVASGGGSALASQTIAREVKLTREGEQPKPVIVSMGGTAASGGYLLSAFGDEIIAQPTSVTGSIGVISIIPNIEGLSENLGVRWVTVGRGANADFAAPYRELTGEEEERLQESVDTSYQEFVEAVAEGRGLPVDEVEPAARGRVWTGSQAVERGLVDRLGGIYTAIESLEERLGRPVELIDYTDTDYRTLSPASLLQGARGAVSHQWRRGLPSAVQELLREAAYLEQFDQEWLLYLSPYRFEP
ncbi:MAG: signal peptide peptidase SppA [Alkalispirochaetaceae bacterium]